MIPSTGAHWRSAALAAGSSATARVTLSTTTLGWAPQQTTAPLRFSRHTCSSVSNDSTVFFTVAERASTMAAHSGCATPLLVEDVEAGATTTTGVDAAPPALLLTPSTAFDAAPSTLSSCTEPAAATRRETENGPLSQVNARDAPVHETDIDRRRTRHSQRRPAATNGGHDSVCLLCTPATRPRSERQREQTSRPSG